jgi:hypothetical protein
MQTGWVTNSFPATVRFCCPFSSKFKELRGKCIHMDDRRSEPRLRVFKAGTIEFGGAGIDCTVRNITATAAALEVASPVGIPHEITLSVPTSQLRAARLRWYGARKNESASP